ncbi:MAG: AAA family ATPase [Planctomycetes bacterium]|nr:AAA family ATPase [Planctomycetota bacterium]MCR4318217.1 AAA family ATPase [Planctomycetota bacterium]
MDGSKRIYDAILEEHLGLYRQMAFVSGPRQVGKTTTCRMQSDAYVNWDDVDDREKIMSGPRAIAASYGIDRMKSKAPVIVFDELHKFPRWKSFLKGFFDVYSERARTIVTGSSRLDVYKRGGDSLMGRYFYYRMHPFTLAETIRQSIPDPKTIVRPPQKAKQTEFDSLWRHGGFPEPFLKRDDRFTRRWTSLRREQIIREDIRDLTGIAQLDQIEVLARILSTRSSCQLVYSNLARELRTSDVTTKNWTESLCSLHFGFFVRPWFKNVARSLRKEPKWFLRDWSEVTDAGQKAETFVACHLLKAVENWTDLGFGKFQLCYLRDKEKREVDFVVIRDEEPWFIIEVKMSDEPLSPSLGYFQNQIRAPFAFQVSIDDEYVDANCFENPGSPIKVPASTFLSQLL